MRPLRLLLLAASLLAAGGAHAQYVAEDSAARRAVPDGPAKAPRPAQPRNEPKTPFFDRVSFGGNFGLSFGNVTYVEVSPLALYNLSPHFQIGPGVTYIYQSINIPGYQYATSIYGGRLLARYIFLENFFAQGEVESLSLEAHNQDFNGRYTIVSPLIGGGYRQPLGSTGAVYLTALYNLNYNTYLSPYPSPLILRVGFTIGGGMFGR